MLGVRCPVEEFERTDNLLLLLLTMMLMLS
jgi:hypothetical protein